MGDDRRLGSPLRSSRPSAETDEVCNVIRAEVAASAPETGAKAMPQRNSSRRLVLRLVLFTLAGWLLWALGRNSALPGADPETATTAVEDGHKPTRAKASGFAKRRLATTLAFATLFFAGAAFSAGAGDLRPRASSTTAPLQPRRPPRPRKRRGDRPPGRRGPAAEDPAAEDRSAEEPAADDPEPAPSGGDQPASLGRRSSSGWR